MTGTGMRRRSTVAAVLVAAFTIAMPGGTAEAAKESPSIGLLQAIGRLAVTGPNGGMSDAFGAGGGEAGVICPGTTVTNGAAAPTPTSFATRPTVTVVYGSSSDCNPIGVLGIRPGRANTPADGNYDVMFCDGPVFKQSKSGWKYAAQEDRGSCFFTDAVPDRAVLMRTMAVVGGSGSGTFRIPFGASRNGPSQAAAITLRRTGPGPNPAGGTPDAMAVPISITS